MLQVPMLQAWGLAVSLATNLLITRGATPGDTTQRVRTGDGLSMGFEGSALASVAVGPVELRSATLPAAGFSVRSYTAQVAGSDLLANPSFAVPGQGHVEAKFWASAGSGYARDASTHDLVLHNSAANSSSRAVQVYKLHRDALNRYGEDGHGDVSFRLSGWASSAGLKSLGTCADEGSCRLHDRFGFSAIARYSDGSTVALPLAAFQSEVHGPEYSFTAIDLPANRGGSLLHSLEISLELTGYQGTARIHNVSLTLFPLVPLLNGTSTRVNATAIRITNTMTHPLPLHFEATVAAHEAHVRIDGAASGVGPGCSAGVSAAGTDHALTIRFALPVASRDGRWFLGTAPDAAVALGASTGVHAGRSTRGYYDGAGEEGTPEGMSMVPPFSSDWFPILALSNGSLGLAIGVPMERTVQISRAEYYASTQLLSLSFDLAISPRSAAFNCTTAFSMIIYRINKPAWGFRAALEKYYTLFPKAYGDAMTVIDQGNWLPFQSTVDIQNYSDFGFRFQEGGSGGAAARTMNTDGCGIYPYIEPHVIHWPVNHSGPCHTDEGHGRNTSGCVTWAELNASVQDCVAHPKKYNKSSTSGGMATICNEIASSALYGPSRERWFFRPESECTMREGCCWHGLFRHQMFCFVPLCGLIAAGAVADVPWNEGAMVYPGLNTKLMADSRTRVYQLTSQIAGFYESASKGNFSINGVYIDSTQGFGAPFLLNYRPEALSDSRQPPVFDGAGGAAVLFVSAVPLDSFHKQRC